MSLTPEQRTEVLQIVLDVLRIYDPAVQPVVERLVQLRGRLPTREEIREAMTPPDPRRT